MKLTTPNILFLFPDQHRGDWMPYNKEVFKKLDMDKVPLRMPNVKEIMKKGVTFTRAVTPSPLCAPARACLAAGVRYDKCKVPDNNYDYPLDQNTFYSVLKENGYQVGGVGKFDLHKSTYWWGKDGWIDDLGRLGFTEGIDNAGKIDAILSYQNYNPFNEDKKVKKGKKFAANDPYMLYLEKNNLASLHLKDIKKRQENKYMVEPTELPEEAYCDNWLTDNGIDILKSFNREQPWFLVFNFTGPHGPWDVTKNMRKAWEEVEMPAPENPEEKNLEIDKIKKVRQNYAAMLENIDRNIGRILQEIEKRGELNNTIIIYTSDHGEMLGDFGKWGKTHPDQPSVHIPLVIKGPGIKEGMTTSVLTELQDLNSTILDYCKLEMPEAEDSLSLKPVLEGKNRKHRKYQVSAFKNWKMAADERYKLIVDKKESGDDEIKLFDLENDPKERNNIVSKKKDKVRELMKVL